MPKPSNAFIGLLWLCLFFCCTMLQAQEFPKVFEDIISFCDSTLTDAQAHQLRTELDALEGYFIQHGLLDDTSAKSYRAVYKRIAQENELNFAMDTSFQLLDSLDLTVQSSCFYKALASDEMRELQPRHVDALQKIRESGEQGGLMPDRLAQSILDQLTEEDFETKYFRYASLLIFRFMAWPMDLEEYGQTDYASFSKLETLAININENDQIFIDGLPVSFEEAKQSTLDFLQENPNQKGIEIKTRQATSYARYLAVMEMVKETYNALAESAGQKISRNIYVHEPEQL